MQSQSGPQARHATGARIVRRAPGPVGRRDPLQEKLDALAKRFDKFIGGGGNNDNSGNGVQSNPAGAGSPAHETDKQQQLRDHIKYLEITIRMVEKCGPNRFQAKAELDKQLKDARQSLAECKPILSQHIAVDHNIIKAEATQRRLAQDVQKQDMFIERANGKLDSLRAQQAAVAKELVLLNQKLVETMPAAVEPSSACQIDLDNVE
eukprot:3582485-Pyramimonas_sp.AAC.1